MEDSEFFWIAKRVIGCLVGCGLFYILAIASPKSSNQKRKKIIELNKENTLILEREKERFEKEEKQKQQAFYSEKEKKLKKLDAEIDANYKNCSLYVKHMYSAKELLDKYYETGILYPTYRNPHAVLSILKYLQSGRCKQLDGPDGAYNLYEQESRMDTVISQLNAMNGLMQQLVRNTADIQTGIRRLNNGMLVLNNRMDQIQNSLLKQEDLMKQYNYRVEVNTEALYQISSDMEAMQSIEELKVIQQQQTNALLEYQNFATKQARLMSGRYY